MLRKGRAALSSEKVLEATCKSIDGDFGAESPQDQSDVVGDGAKGFAEIECVQAGKDSERERKQAQRPIALGDRLLQKGLRRRRGSPGGLGWRLQESLHRASGECSRIGKVCKRGSARRRRRHQGIERLRKAGAERIDGVTGRFVFV